MDEISKGEIFYNNLSEETKAGFKDACDAVDRVTSAINNLIPTITMVAAGIYKWYSTFFTSYPNKRVVHLATHGKMRTRKKNIKRIIHYYYCLNQ